MDNLVGALAEITYVSSRSVERISGPLVKPETLQKARYLLQAARDRQQAGFKTLEEKRPRDDGVIDGTAEVIHPAPEPEARQETTEAVSPGAGKRIQE